MAKGFSTNQTSFGWLGGHKAFEIITKYSYQYIVENILEILQNEE